MDNEWYNRTDLLIGPEAVKKLQASHVLVAGLGGVGAIAAELVCRAGIGKMTIVDADKVTDSNRNRQLLALTSTINRQKAPLMAERLLDINPRLDMVVFDKYIKDDMTAKILFGRIDYVIDAIDTLSPKVYLIVNALKNGLNIVSSMGAGGKSKPELVQVADIEDSFGCKLAYSVRKRLHRLGIRNGFKVVFSPEQISKNAILHISNERNKITTLGTISYMPAIFGCYCASVVIRDLIDGKTATPE